MARIENVYDATTNDSNKSWVVPDGEIWELLYAHVTLTSTATVGNRQVDMRILDENSNELLDVIAGAVQAATLTRHYWFAQGVYRETSFVNGEMHVPIADDFYLKPGWTVQVLDSTAVDAAADDMTVALVYKVRSTGEL